MTLTIRKTRTYVPTGEVGRRLSEAKLLQAQIAKLSAQLDEHREWFLEHMSRLHLDTVGTDDFTVQRKQRHRWSYSAATEREMNAIRALQKWEQVQGVATDDPTVYVSFTSKAP